MDGPIGGQIKTNRRWGLLVAILLIIIPVVAGGSASTNDWAAAKILKSPLTGKILYGQLGRRQGDAYFFQFNISQPSNLPFRLSVPGWSSTKFKPQIVVYQPDAQTIGPVTGLIQPPGTIASIYPSTTDRRHFEIASCVSQRVRQNSMLSFPAAGKYYLSVYNAGQVGGRWRLSFGHRPSLVDLFLWPQMWWRDQAWVGWTMQTLFVPLWLLALLGIGWLIRPSKKIKPTRRKKT